MTKLFIPPTIRHVARDHGTGYSIAVVGYWNEMRSQVPPLLC